MKTVGPVHGKLHETFIGEQVCEQTHSCNKRHFAILLRTRKSKVGIHPQYVTTKF